MGGTDRISQPPGKIAGKRKNSGLWNIATQKLPKIYFSVSKQLLRKTTSCTASFTRRVITFGTRYGKITLFLNTLSMRKSAYVMMFGCIDGRGFRRMQLKSRLIKLNHFELNWFILNPLNQTESAESYWICWVILNLLNHIESVWITLNQSESHCKLFVLKTESKSWQRTSDFMALIVRHNLVRMVLPNLKHM